MRLIIALLAALRLTRFITTDFLGEWLVVGPLKDAAGWDYDAPVNLSDPRDMHYGTPAQRAATGLDCAFCVSFWIVLLVGALEALPLPDKAARLRSLLIGSLAGSYVVGHLSSKLD